MQLGKCAYSCRRTTNMVYPCLSESTMQTSWQQKVLSDVFGWPTWKEKKKMLCLLGRGAHTLFACLQFRQFFCADIHTRVGADPDRPAWLWKTQFVINCECVQTNRKSAYSCVLKMTVSMEKPMDAARPKSGFKRMVRMKVATQTSCGERQRGMNNTHMGDIFTYCTLLHYFIWKALTLVWLWVLASVSLACALLVCRRCMHKHACWVAYP